MKMFARLHRMLAANNSRSFIKNRVVPENGLISARIAQRGCASRLLGAGWVRASGIGLVQ